MSKKTTHLLQIFLDPELWTEQKQPKIPKVFLKEQKKTKKQKIKTPPFCINLLCIQHLPKLLKDRKLKLKEKLSTQKYIYKKKLGFYIPTSNSEYCSEYKDHDLSQRFHTLRQDSSKGVILYKDFISVPSRT